MHKTGLLVFQFGLERQSAYHDVLRTKGALELPDESAATSTSAGNMSLVVPDEYHLWPDVPITFHVFRVTASFDQLQTMFNMKKEDSFRKSLGNWGMFPVAPNRLHGIYYITSNLFTPIATADHIEQFSKSGYRPGPRVAQKRVLEGTHPFRWFVFGMVCNAFLLQLHFRHTTISSRE